MCVKEQKTLALKEKFSKNFNSLENVLKNVLLDTLAKISQNIFVYFLCHNILRLF